MVRSRMSGKPFLDTNVLIYAFCEDDPRSEIARELLARGCVIGIQTLNEFVAVTRRKLRMTLERSRGAAGSHSRLMPIADSSHHGSP